MYLVRDIFQTKPGKATELVAKFKQAMPAMRATGIKSQRVMTDAVAGYWTVVMESEVETLDGYFVHASGHPEVGEAMKGYMELVLGGRREIFKLE